MLHPTILHDVGPTILASFEDLDGYISVSFRALKTAAGGRRDATKNYSTYTPYFKLRLIWLKYFK